MVGGVTVIPVAPAASCLLRPDAPDAGLLVERLAASHTVTLIADAFQRARRNQVICSYRVLDVEAASQLATSNDQRVIVTEREVCLSVRMWVLVSELERHIVLRQHEWMPKAARCATVTMSAGRHSTRRSRDGGSRRER